MLACCPAVSQPAALRQSTPSSLRYTASATHGEERSATMSRSRVSRGRSTGSAAVQIPPMRDRATWHRTPQRAVDALVLHVVDGVRVRSSTSRPPSHARARARSRRLRTQGPRDRPPPCRALSRSVTSSVPISAWTDVARQAAHRLTASAACPERGTQRRHERLPAPPCKQFASARLRFYPPRAQLPDLFSGPPET